MASLNVQNFLVVGDTGGITIRGSGNTSATNAITLSNSTPAIGLIVYQTDATEGLYIYKSTGWTFII